MSCFCLFFEQFSGKFFKLLLWRIWREREKWNILRGSSEPPLQTSATLLCCACREQLSGAIQSNIHAQFTTGKCNANFMKVCRGCVRAVWNIFDKVVVFCPPGQPNKKKHLHTEVNISLSLNL